MRLAALVLATAAVAQKKPKEPPPPTQATIYEGCVTVSDIHSHKRGWTVGPGVDGLAYNGCAGPVHISMTIAYYDAKGVQFATGYELGEVAPGASWRFRHTPIMEAHQSALRSAKIIRVLVGR